MSLKVAAGAINLNINGVGVCIVIPQLRCFCCQLIPVFNLGSALASKRSTITYTDVSTQVTTCTVSVTPCSGREQKSFLLNRNHGGSIRLDQIDDINPSLVEKYLAFVWFFAIQRV